MKTKLYALLAFTIFVIVFSFSLPTWAINNNPNLLWKGSLPNGPELYKFGFYVEERDNLRDGMENFRSIQKASAAAASATSGMGKLFQRILETRQGQWVVIGLQINSNQSIYVSGSDALQFVGMFNGGRDSLMTSAEIIVSENKQQTKIFSTAHGQVRIHDDLYTQTSKFNDGKKLVVIYVHLLNCQNVQDITEVRPTSRWREG